MEKFYFILFIISTVAFIVQSILGFIGFDDIDISDGDGLVGFFTLRNLIAFLLGFSSSGYLMLTKGFGDVITTIVSIGFGLFLSGIVMLGMKFMKRLQQENKIDSSDYRALTGTVLVKIPANKAGQGKVEFTLNGRADEMYAVTDDEEDLVKGTQIQIIRKLDNNSLLVSKSLNIW